MTKFTHVKLINFTENTPRKFLRFKKKREKRDTVTRSNCYCAGIACDKCNPIGNIEGVMKSTPLDR